MSALASCASSVSGNWCVLIGWGESAPKNVQAEIYSPYCFKSMQSIVTHLLDGSEDSKRSKSGLGSRPVSVTDPRARGIGRPHDSPHHAMLRTTHFMTSE